MQTRKDKWAKRRLQIEMENLNYMFTNYQKYFYIRLHQKEIKKKLGCKH